VTDLSTREPDLQHDAAGEKQKKYRGNRRGTHRP
jgi:hypothetical protein